MLPGAQVQLLTGGPIMTAEEMLPNGEIKCSWTDDTGKLQEGSFEPAALILVNPDGSQQTSPPGEASLG
jgi:uncharacterized protein YodC (DUF2158 family)